MSGEDLTTQAGLAVQQELALVNLLGLTHVERNGHHYVNGMAELPEHEQNAFLAAHSDLYEHSRGAARLKIRNGRLAIGSLACAGFAWCFLIGRHSGRSSLRQRGRRHAPEEKLTAHICRNGRCRRHRKISVRLCGGPLPPLAGSGSSRK
jgi:hypothetical protein